MKCPMMNMTTFLWNLSKVLSESEFDNDLIVVSCPNLTKYIVDIVVYWGSCVCFLDFFPDTGGHFHSGDSELVTKQVCQYTQMCTKDQATR